MNTSSPTDPTLELRDIRPAIDIPESAGWPLWATLSLIALTLAVGGILWWRWHVGKQASSAPDAVTLALAELESARDSLDSVDAETYAMAVSDVLRRFIEGHFKVAAVRQTSEEFLQGFTSPSHEAILTIDQTHRSVLRDFLRRCDLVKFACGRLDRAQREQLHDVARSFIQTCSHGPGTDAEPAIAARTTHNIPSAQRA